MRQFTIVQASDVNVLCGEALSSFEGSHSDSRDIRWGGSFWLRLYLVWCFIRINLSQHAYEAPEVAPFT